MLTSLSALFPDRAGKPSRPLLPSTSARAVRFGKQLDSPPARLENSQSTPERAPQGLIQVPFSPFQSSVNNTVRSVNELEPSAALSLSEMRRASMVPLRTLRTTFRDVFEQIQRAGDASDSSSDSSDSDDELDLELIREYSDEQVRENRRQARAEIQRLR